MADLTITAANVIGTESGRGIASVAIAAGEAVARNASGALILADSNAGTDATDPARTSVGVALNSAAAGQPVAFAGAGREITVGAVLTAGTEYWLSGTAGKICPRADVAAGMTPTLIGIAKSTSSLRLILVNSGVTL